MSQFKARIFTLFPDLFPGYLNFSIIGDALRRKIWELEVINIRDFAVDKHHTVDDTPFGGGSGMVIKAEVIASALEKNITDLHRTRLIYPSPRGKLFNQNMARELAKSDNLAIICGRYEGIDQRVIDHYNIEEISLGDYILSGGELPAMVILDGIIRNLENVLGASNSLDEESFGKGNNTDYDYLLEYPHYTKPANWRNISIPDILLSGHHQNIATWRLQQAQSITRKRRPDLYRKYLRNIKSKIHN